MAEFVPMCWHTVLQSFLVNENGSHTDDDMSKQRRALHYTTASHKAKSEISQKAFLCTTTCGQATCFRIALEAFFPASSSSLLVYLWNKLLHRPAGIEPALSIKG